MEYKDLWSKELSSDEKKSMNVMRLNDKDILTDFEFLHDDNFVEVESENVNRIAFYNNNCLWQILYAFNDSSFSLDCLYSPTSDYFDKSFKDIKERLFACTDNSDELSPIVHLMVREDKRVIIVTHYSLD